MLVVPHPTKKVWVLLGCLSCTEEIPRNMYVYGFGHVMPSGDDEIRVAAPVGTPKAELKTLYEETMAHYLEKRSS